MGRAATVKVWAVEDLHMNRLEFAVEHDFSFANLTLGDAAVEIKGLALDLPFRSGMDQPGTPEFAAIAGGLAADIASVSGADASRVHVSAIGEAADGTVIV